MDEKQFQQFFVIAYLASRSAQLARTVPHRENETVVGEAKRYSDVCWLHFCQLWPVNKNLVNQRHLYADNPPQGEKEE